jgi:hypothetical protein
VTVTGEVVIVAGCVVEAAVCVVVVAADSGGRWSFRGSGGGRGGRGASERSRCRRGRQRGRRRCAWNEARIASCVSARRKHQTDTGQAVAAKHFGPSIDRSIDRSLTSVVFAAAAARGSESAIGHVSGWTVNERAVSGMLSGAFGALSHIGHRIDARLTNETKPTDRLDSRFTNEHVTRTVPFADATQADRRRRRIGTLRPFDARRRPKEKCYFERKVVGS